MSNNNILESYQDNNGRWVIQMRCMDSGVWSLITGQPAMVSREFSWWKLWMWPSLLLERCHCRVMARSGPLSGVSFSGVAKQDGKEITECMLHDIRFFNPNREKLL